MENWKQVVGYEGIYEVSDNGNVRSVDRYDRMGRLQTGKVLRKAKQTNGYLYVTLRKGGEQHHALIHRLVAIAFLDNFRNYPEVNHINENKEDNSAGNLEWCDHKYNINHGTGHARSAKKQGRRVRQLSLNGEFIREYDSVREAARDINRSHKDIHRVCDGSRHTSGGFKWEYA